MKLLLFDIDGTLIDSGGAGSRALGQAFEKLLGVPDAFAEIGMAGKTDLQILKEGLVRSGIEATDEIIHELCIIYLRYLEQNMRHAAGHVKTGIPEVLSALERNDDFALGLLTGNIKAGAEIKLRHFRLDGFFRDGAFGDEDADRNKLLPIAAAKFRTKSQGSFSYGDCVIIGDTPRDIACARPYGARAVAVATGPYSFMALADEKPDLVFHDFSDTGSVMRALQGL